LCRAPISTTRSFGSGTIPVARHFCMHLHAFHSCCTMPKFSMPLLRTITLHAPLTKLSRQHIPTLCVHQLNSFALCQYYAHHVHHYYVCAHHAIVNLARAPAHQHFCMPPRNIKFAHQHTTIFPRSAKIVTSPTTHGGPRYTREHFLSLCGTYCNIPNIQLSYAT
jgi:hypothetical protein